MVVFDVWCLVGEESVQCFVQFVIVGVWYCLVEVVEQGMQVLQVLQLVFQQVLVVVEVILFGQLLVVVEQVLGDGGEGIVQWGFCQQFLGWGIDFVVVWIEQVVVVFGFVDVVGYQWQVGGQFCGQFQQCGGIVLVQFQFQFVDFFLVVVGDYFVQVECCFYDYFGFVVVLGDFGVLVDEVGVEDWFELFFVEIFEGCWLVFVVEFFQVEFVFFQVLVLFVVFG